MFMLRNKNKNIVKIFILGLCCVVLVFLFCLRTFCLGKETMVMIDESKEESEEKK